MKKIIISYFNDEISRELRWSLMSPLAGEKTVDAVKAVQAINGYTQVAEFEYDDKVTLEDNLENAYRVLQNGIVSDSWLLDPPDGLTPLVSAHVHDGNLYGWRSAMKGDLFSVDGKAYVVANIGFTEVV
jgi:hypothetical protein